MEVAVSPISLLPRSAPDFRGGNRLQDEPHERQIVVHQQGFTDPEDAKFSCTVTSSRSISTTSHITTLTLPEASGSPLPPASNDNSEEPETGKAKRKRRSRRKPKRDDKRRSRRSLVISKQDYKGGLDAWHRARRSGLSLDTLVTLRPAEFEFLSEQGRHAWSMKRLKSFGQWYADNDDRPEFAALWSRESKRIGEGRNATAEGEHMHLLVHAGEHRTDLERMLRKQLKGQREVDVRPATQDVLRLNCGWLGDAATYVLKAVSQQVWRNNRKTPHRPSGTIWGARCGWTNNIGSAAQ